MNASLYQTWASAQGGQNLNVGISRALALVRSLCHVVSQDLYAAILNVTKTLADMAECSHAKHHGDGEDGHLDAKQDGNDAANAVELLKRSCGCGYCGCWVHGYIDIFVFVLRHMRGRMRP